MKWKRVYKLLLFCVTSFIFFPIFSEEDTDKRIHIKGIYFVQGVNTGKDIFGEGYTLDLEAEYTKEQYSLYARIHTGEGIVIEDELGINLFGNTNSLVDDNVQEGYFQCVELYVNIRIYDNITITVGKTEPLIFIDQNQYANDEYINFAGKYFLNNPIFDSEDIYSPLVAIRYDMSGIFWTFLVQSSDKGNLTWNGSIWELEEKNVYKSYFDKPLLAFEVNFYNHYRLYAWFIKESHIKVGDKINDNTYSPMLVDGYGIGISFDKDFSSNYGIFIRFSVANKEAYMNYIFGSLGINYRGILGIGVGISVYRDELLKEMKEYQSEFFYTYHLSDLLYLGINLLYAYNTQGIFSGIWRIGFEF